MACLALLALAGCGGAKTEPAGEPARAPRPQPDARVEAGKRLVMTSGCLACHQIGSNGRSGPGNNLDGIGTRRSASELRRALIETPAPMPSFTHMARRDRDAIVAYLSALRGSPGCATHSDCG